LVPGDSEVRLGESLHISIEIEADNPD